MKISVVHLQRGSTRDFTVFANFAEDVFREYMNNPEVEVDLEAVDQGSPVLVISSRAGRKGGIETRLSQFIKKHMLEGDVRAE